MPDTREPLGYGIHSMWRSICGTQENRHVPSRVAGMQARAYFSRTGMIVIIVALCLFADIAAARLAADCARAYVVEENDTYDQICAELSVSTFQLAHVNPQIDPACDNLVAGELLCLGITGQDCALTWVVENGDSCASIAYDTNIDLSTLLRNNPNINAACSNIHPGEVLCTAATDIQYSS